MDGRGYPDNLPKSEIPLESRLIAVLDAYDAMTGTSADGHRRLYRDPVTSEKALEELRRCSGSQFDGRVVKAFEAVLKNGKGGAL
jgi:HD-GYP domain-containing protein (c-di-GMP phosphodiesterase class II)